MTNTIERKIEKVEKREQNQKEAGKMKMVVYEHNCMDSARYHLRKYKHWAKLITGVDTTKTNGFAFQGEWLQVTSQNLVPNGSLVVEFCEYDGSREFKLYRVTQNGKEEISTSSREKLVDFIQKTAEELEKGIEQMVGEDAIGFMRDYGMSLPEIKEFYEWYHEEYDDDDPPSVFYLWEYDPDLYEKMFLDTITEYVRDIDPDEYIDEVIESLETELGENFKVMDQFWEDLVEEKYDEIMDMEEEAVRQSFYTDSDLYLIFTKDGKVYYDTKYPDESETDKLVLAEISGTVTEDAIYHSMSFWSPDNIIEEVAKLNVPSKIINELKQMVEDGEDLDIYILEEMYPDIVKQLLEVTFPRLVDWVVDLYYMEERYDTPSYELEVDDIYLYVDRYVDYI